MPVASSPTVEINEKTRMLQIMTSAWKKLKTSSVRQLRQEGFCCFSTCISMLIDDQEDHLAMKLYLSIDKNASRSE